MGFDPSLAAALMPRVVFGSGAMPGFELDQRHEFHGVLFPLAVKKIVLGIVSSKWGSGQWG